MKSTTYLAFFGLLLMGCRSTEQLPQEKKETISHELGACSLELHKPVTVGELTVNLLKVEESRCPLNVNCIRAGSAVTHVQLQDARGNSATKILYLGDALAAPENRGPRSADTVHVSMTNKVYRLILTEVLPLPNASDPSPAPVTAKMSVVAL
ncbi:hypothetical protein ACFSC6_21875 [Rufibacter sediminis]|uniref:Lipoprotein n=1 Tax=Rufibacter sediminis TaxID=2762756 RepID=A0ABR6VV59_9BACT|nr:hypothetical protein [Rufibacter sediminis]MBC3540789.1 hypothetical protein [Rufibacter sediminis]